MASAEAENAARDIFDIVARTDWCGQDERARFAEIIDTHHGPIRHALDHAGEAVREAGSDAAFQRQRDRAEAAVWAKGVAETRADQAERNLERAACVVAAADRLAAAVDAEGMRRHDGMTSRAVKTRLELAVIDAGRDYRLAREKLKQPEAE